MFFGNVQYLISSLPEWDTLQYSEFRIEIRIYTKYIPYLDYETLSFDVWTLPCSGNIRVAEFGKDQLVQNALITLSVLFSICHHVLSVRLCFLFSLCVDENLIITPPLSSLFDVDLLRKQETRIAKKSYFSIYLAQEQAGVGLM